MQTSRVAAFAVLFVGCSIAASAALAQTEALKDLPPTWAPGDRALKWGGCPDGLPKGCQLAVLNGDPAKPGADVFLKLPAKSKVPSHKHTSVERIVMVEGDLSLTYDGHKPLTLKRGTYHYGTAGAVHEATCLSVQPCVLFISFEKPVDLIPAPMASAAVAPAKAAAPSKAAPPKATAPEPKVKKGGC
jgi:quercetin dioxygenase-like cupin family protein